MSRSRVDIAGMLAEKTAAVAQADAHLDEVATPPDAPPPAASPTPRRHSSTTAARPKPPPPAGPKWQQCEPRTFYVWPESIDQLQAVARRLQRERRKGEGERITMATLVRVAIAGLLEHADDLAGVDEASVLDSYRKALHHLRTDELP
jgi:hypothetical protein